MLEVKKKNRIKDSLDMNKMNNKETLLYMYILGTGNRENYLRGVVPYRINNEEVFFGPCKVPIRKEVKTIKDELNGEYKGNPKIYLVGINPTKSRKPRKILFVGEIINIFTFKEAWEHYDKIKSEDFTDDYKEKVEKMINGIESKKGTTESPLFLKPIKDKGIDGYKHRTDMHKNRWKLDLLSSTEIKKIKQTPQNEIFKNKDSDFAYDCCFKMKNIHISFNEKNQCPIDLTDKMFELIKPVVLEKRPDIQKDNLKKPDITSPFGYNIKDERYGRGHIILRNAEAEEFIQLLLEKK